MIPAIRISSAAVPSATVISNVFPISNRAEYTTASLFSAFCKEKPKDIAKAGSYLAFWAIQAFPDLPSGVKKLNSKLRDFKNFISTIEVPEKLCTLVRSLHNLARSKTVDGNWKQIGVASRRVFKDTMSLVSSTADSIDFASLFIPISKETLRRISNVNLAATFAFASNGAIEQVQSINNMEKIDPKRTTFYLISLARDVSYVALAVISLSALFTATTVAPWVIVACLTSGLTFSIGGYFYERMVDPENKGKDLNPARVVENLVNQRNYEQRLARA